MNKKMVVLIVLSMIFGMLQVISNNADGITTTIYSDPTDDGGIQSFHVNDYDIALWGTGSLSIQGPLTAEMLIGQFYKSTGIGLGYYQERGYLSFDTSGIDDSEEIVSVTLFIQAYWLQPTNQLDFDVKVHNVDYGSSLDATLNDWNVTGGYEGILLNTSLLVEDQWYSMQVTPELLNKSGLTQYKFTSGFERNNVTGSYLARFYTSTFNQHKPYLEIVTKSTGEGMVQYWDAHTNDHFSDDFETGNFISNWTTYGSPVVSLSYNPYEGIYHAGASFGFSGAGNHTFEVDVNTTGFNNVTISYYRSLQDLGPGTVSLIVDWYNGTSWNILENITASSLYSKSLWLLNSTADNNPNLTFRFNITVTAGSVNNGAWIDIVNISSCSGYHMHSNNTIYPVEIIPWNNTHEQIRYEVFVTEITDSCVNWIYLIVDENYTYQSINPNSINVTYEWNGKYNITDPDHLDIMHHIWFLREKTIVQSEINIKLWHSTLGEGFFWEKWLVKINPGIYYDNSTARVIPNPTYYVEYGSGNWTITILDYFNNHIVNRSFVANAYSINLLIDVPVHTFKAKNLRRDTTLVSIYFNATGDPFTQQLVIDETWAVPVREGTYMFVFTFLATLDNLTYNTGQSYFYNLTVDGDYTAYIGSDKIQIIYTDVNGLEIEVDNILTWVIGDVLVNRTIWPITITDETRSSNSFIADLPILIHPYAVIDADVYTYENGVTSATFNRPFPTTGTVTVISDELTIMSDFDTQIYVNRTGDSSNIINVTSPGMFDLTTYINSTNFTFWSNNTASLRRVTNFQQASVFFWKWTRSEGKFETGLSLNNTGNFNWRNVKWYIGIPSGILLDATTLGRIPAIYDMDNEEYWELGLDYKVKTDGFYTDFAFINTSVIRNIYLTFYEANATFYPGSATMEIFDYERTGISEDAKFKGAGTWINLQSGTYRDDFYIVMHKLAGEVLESSIEITDKDGNAVYEFFPEYSSEKTTAIRIPYNEVGDIPNSESVSFTVLFQYERILLPTFPWLLFFVVSFVILTVAGVIVVIAKKQDRGLLAIATLIIASVLIIISMIAFSVNI